MLNRQTIAWLLSLCILPFISVSQAPRSYTSSEILLQLKKLNTVGSVLYIAAHPDDENTRLIAYLANEKCLRTGYLSLTRGDGGQNLIGSEQGVELGVIRTQELLAARRTDGGEQFFTRAYDFGFSKSPEETFRKWNHDSVLADVVWVIRNFRPDMIITRFAPDGSGGHGHHTASAMLAEEAFDAAADPNRFPEQLAKVSVWKTRRLFYNTIGRFRDPNADMSAFIKLDVGGYNALLGKSYGEIAAESRSMHRSQGFGSAKQRGESFEYFKPVKGDTSGLKDIFQGMDFSWKRIPGSKDVSAKLEKTIREFNIQAPHRSLKAVQEVSAAIFRMRMKVNASYEPALIDKWFEGNKVEFAVSGIFMDVTSTEYYISQGTPGRLIFEAVSRSLDSVLINGTILDTTVNKTLRKDEAFRLPQQWENHYVYDDALQNYWLKNGIKNSMYNISQAENFNPETIVTGIPFDYRFLYGNKEMNMLREERRIQYKWVDPSKGELYRPLVITPPVMINPVSDAITFNSIESKELKVTLKAGKDNVKGTVKIAIPKGWSISANGNAPQTQAAAFDFKLGKKGDEEIITFMITSSAEAVSEQILVTAETEGSLFSKGFKEIKYDHIPVQTIFPEAGIKLVKLDVKHNMKRIGYIPGAGDEVQPSLAQLGYEVITITDEMLAKDNLKRFDAIITGVRAYNTNDKLPLYKKKLMDYVEAGGNLVVQYNTNSWAGPLSSDIGPYKFKITRDRITDEDAKVNFDLPSHPVLNTPNKITEKDFEGWIQERSIYHASEWDPAFAAPLSMADPGEKSNAGALIIAKHGKGHFVYTGLVFFRELPAGVPGAYRLFVNIIELGK